MTVRADPLVEGERDHRGAFPPFGNGVHRSRGFTSSDIISPQIPQSTAAIRLPPDQDGIAQHGHRCLLTVYYDASDLALVVDIHGDELAVKEQA